MRGNLREEKKTAHTHKRARKRKNKHFSFRNFFDLIWVAASNSTMERHCSVCRRHRVQCATLSAMRCILNNFKLLDMDRSMWFLPAEVSPTNAKWFVLLTFGASSATSTKPSPRWWIRQSNWQTMYVELSYSHFSIYSIRHTLDFEIRFLFHSVFARTI